MGQTLAITTWYNCTDNPAGDFESSPTYAAAEANGFVAPSSTSGNIGYGGAKAHSSRIRYFYATGITSVAIISHDNGSSKYVQLKIEEVASNGDLSAVTTIDSPNKSSSTLSLIEYTTALNPSKYYKISCTSNNSSNCKVYQIRFGKYIAPATNYTITYDKNGGDGTMENSTNTVSACTFTAPTGKEFKEWNTLATGLGDSYDPGDAASSDLDLFAIWQTKVEKFTVKYMDGTTELGSETVEVGQHPTGSEIADPTKDCYTFAGWDPALSTVSGTDGATVYVNATWTGNYFTTSVDFENGDESTVSGIASKNIVASNAGSYDGGKASENWAYKGWKIKSNGATVKVLVQANKKLTYKFGYLDATAHVNITNDNITREVTGASKEEGNPLKYTTFSHIKDYDAVYTFTTGSSGAAVIKALSVEAVYTAYFEDEMDVVTTTVVGNVTEVELPTPSVTTKSGKNFIGWKADQAVTVGGVAKAANTLLSAGDVAVLSATTTFTAQWVAPENFDVKFFQGYGDPDVQIGDKQTISTGNFAVAPADPERAGFVFLGWSYDATEAHIVNVAAYGITTATNFTAMWKAVWTVTFDGAGAVNVEDGETVASPNSPVMSGKVFQGWYNGESKYDFSAAVTGNLALESKWAAADPNHYVYAYNDDFHFDGVVYKTPEGKVDGGSGTSNIALTTPYTLFAGAEGITSIVMTDGIYDSKTGAIQAVTALMKVNNNATSKLTVTIKSGYTATLKIKSSGYSATRTINVSDATPASGTTTGQAVTSGAMSVSGIGELSFALNAGSHDLTVTGGTLYIAELDIEATALPTYAVTYAANGGEGTMTDANEYYEGAEVTLLENTFTPASGFMWSGWIVTGNVSGDPIAVSEGKFTMPDEAVTVTAQWEDVSKVAVIVETNVKYETLAAAIAAAETAQTVQLLQNIHQEDGVLINKSLTLDLNGKTFTVDNGNSYVNRAIKVDAGTGTVLIKDGTVDALSTEDHNGGCYGGLRIETGNVTCTNVTFKNYRIYGMGVKPAGGTLVMNECTVISEIGGGMEVAGGSVVLNNCTFTQTGFDTAHAWISSCLGIGHNANLTVNGGTYTSEHYSLYVFTSGGEIDVESGSFTGDIVNQVTLSSYPDAVGAINISGGSFEGVGGNPIHFTTDNTGKTTIAISGGTFDAPVENQYCAPGYVPSAEVAPGVYTVVPKDGVCLVKIEPTSQTKGTQTGLYADGDELTINLSSGMNLGGSGKYIGVKATENFQEGDVLHLNMSTYQNSQNATAYVYADKDASVFLFDTEEKCDENKDYYITMPAAVNGHKELYIIRTEGNKWNGGPSVMEVTRAMKPMLTAITIDGRDGVIDEVNKTVAVNIPFEAELDNLTIVDEVVWNAPAASDAKVVTTNGGDWVEAPATNTYRLTDKDGDYTDYTITLTRDVLKHTVSYNTHGGSAVASELVEDGGYLAAAPADPTKEDYIFQYWSEDEDGAEVDVTTVQINADKEFHAVWNLNTTNFISPAKTTIEIADVEHVCLAEFNSNRSSSLAGATPTDMVKYDATTDEAKIKITFYNSNSGIKKAVLYKFEEGAEAPEKIEIEVPGQQIWTTEYYTFNSSKNRSFYVCMNDRSYIRVLQVKVVDNGANPVKQFGQVGYSLNLNKGRFYAKAAVEKSFEGFTFTPSSEYKVYNNSNLATTSANSFTIASPTVMSVKRSGGKYYVYQDPADKGTLYTADAEIELNTTGTWYISSETGSSAASFTKIEFLAPKCEKPVFGTMSDIDLCAGDAFTAIDGTATVSDGGVVSYKWYKEGSETVLGTAATYTPSADGNYYVVATNSLADHQDNSATSDVVKVEHFAAAAIVTAPEDIATQAGQEKTLTIVASGANLQYVWYTCDDAEGTNPVAIVPAQTTASLTVTVPDGVQYYKVAVTDNCGADLSAVVKVEGWTDLPQVDVTASTVWDMNNVSASEINLASMTPSKQNVLLLLANIEGVNNNASFNSQALMFEGQRIGRTENNVKYVSGQYVQFNVTVPGMVSVTFASNGSAQRTILINGKQCSRTTNDGTYIKYDVAVEPGSVVIEDVQGYVRISKIEFKAGDNYHRTVNPSYLGTLCWTNNAVLGGATLYEFAGKNEYNYLVFDEVAENRLEAGKPYIFMPENGNTLIKVYNTDNEEPKGESDLQPVNHMYGTITGKTLVPGEDDNMYYFSASHIWAVKDFVVNINVPAYYCYVDYEGVLNDEPAPAPAPGRRRVTMGVQGQQVATGIEDVQGDKVQCTKMLINGQLFILRGEKMYDAKGQLVK